VILKIEYFPINNIKPYENNPRNNDQAVEKVSKSIKAFGFKNPIIIDENKIIINGHTRLKAAKQLELDTVPCIIVNDLSEDKKKAFRIADNRIGQEAEWDYELLKLEFEYLDENLVDKTGFDLDEINLMINGWQSNHELMDKISAEDSVALDKIIVKCSSEQKQEVYEAITNAVQSLGYDDVEVT
jgi:ParB/RepB/Spo0J family partition protein|tara:strand:+ start:79 stop:633 length:555 start_codon:yes stop_codon:yes gene_type:complete